MVELVLFFLIGLVALIWYTANQGRERALFFARAECRKRQCQLLDQTVQFERYQLNGRDGHRRFGAPTDLITVWKALSDKTGFSGFRDRGWSESLCATKKCSFTEQGQGPPLVCGIALGVSLQARVPSEARTGGPGCNGHPQTLKRSGKPRWLHLLGEDHPGECQG